MPAVSPPPLTPAVRQVSGTACQLGESPLWHPVSQQLYWVDITGQTIVRAVGGSLVAEQAQAPEPGLEAPAEQRWQLDDQPSCLAPARNGDLVVGLRKGVALFAPGSGECALLAAAPWDTQTTRSNDGRCDPAGRFWTGTVFEPKTGNHAHLYCLRGSAGRWRLDAVLDDNLTANGLAFDPARNMAWWSNTPAHVIYRYPFDRQRGLFGARTVFHQFAPRQQDMTYGGRPDGACLDTAGHYWVAMYEGSRVLRLDPTGNIVLDLRLPVTCPTMVCLGGTDLRTLFITSASKGRPPAELAAEPLAGHVLAVHLDALGLPADVRGLPADLFAEPA